MAGLRLKVRAYWDGVPVRERWLLAAAMALSAAIVATYVLATRPNELLGDQIEYHEEGVFFTEGRFWWTELPFGVAHEGMWKAPGYPAWTGFWYELLGTSPFRLALVQGFILAPLSVCFAWLLSRRLFGDRAASVTAFVVAAFPLAWEHIGLLYPEALAIPLTTLVLYSFLGREPTRTVVLATGLLMGVSLLVRPTAFFLFAGIAAAWIVAEGWRRGLLKTATTVGLAVLVVLPWTVRNFVVTDGGFVPISVQDGAIYGTFNDESANDPENPYAWRFVLEDPPDVLEGPPVDDPTLRRELTQAGFDYIQEHPFSVVEAFFWNGLSRFWDVRRPGHAVDEVPFEGRSKPVTIAGLAMYYVLLPLALFGLWRLRHRREILIPLLALAAGASIVFMTASGTRYRAPLEPLIAVLAVSAVVPRRETDAIGGTTAAAPPAVTA
jgi:4-amino-4-deoxy-L-arabinose transferase-like glycosyltransferase